MKPGATGKYPRGKLGRHDEGELTVGIAHDSYGNVVINFGKLVKWIALPPGQVIALAKLLLANAGATKIEISFGPEKEKPLK